MEIDKFHYTI